MADLPPVSKTAFYCCALRASDAASPHPVCGDTFAARFLDDRTVRDLQPLTRMRNPAAGNVARHRLVDDIVRGSLVENPQRRIILVGAGFDTRAFRLSGGRWWELDDPELVAFKDTRLPAAGAPNALTRVAVSFGAVAPREYLAPLAGTDEALVILEGVSLYLSDATLNEFAGALIAALPNATLVCDLMSPAFARRFSRGLHRELTRMGAAFGERHRHPSLAFLDAGYQTERRVSIVERACEAGTVAIPRWVLNSVLRELRDGYALWCFNADKSSIR